MLRSAAERREEAKEQAETAKAQAKLQRDMRRLTAVLRERPDGDTVTALANAAGLSHTRGRVALDAMLDLDQIVACQVIKGNNRKLNGYQLVSNGTGPAGQ